MKIIRLGLHSLALAATNLAAILIAYGLYVLIRARQPTAHQVIIQAPVAAFLSVVVFCGWCWGLQRLTFKRLQVRSLLEWAAIFLGSLLWTPVLFFPLHAVTQGYLASFSNILAIWLFQAPVNFLAVVAALQLLRPPLEPFEGLGLS